MWVRTDKSRWEEGRINKPQGQQKVGEMKMGGRHAPDCHLLHQTEATLILENQTPLSPIHKKKDRTKEIAQWLRENTLLLRTIRIGSPAPVLASSQPSVTPVLENVTFLVSMVTHTHVSTGMHAHMLMYVWVHARMHTHNALKLK